MRTLGDLPFARPACGRASPVSRAKRGGEWQFADTPLVCALMPFATSA
jgi:hypothetical protein